MKRNNREVNIFNMSLLDILCGALGAFCFLMLSLLPYYRPPGKDISVSREQKELLDELQKIKDLTERLKSASTAEDLTELVKQLREMITKLENEIKQLQGQVNALYAENDELKTRVAKLEVENGILRTRNEKLERENQQLLAEKQRLLARNEQLEQQNQQLQQEKQQIEQQKRELENRLQQKLPWSVTVTANDTRLPLDCSLHEQVVTANDDSRQPDFDPALPVQPSKWIGDYRLGGMGSVTRVQASRFAGGENKFYIKVNAPHSVPRAPGAQAPPLVLNTELAGANLTPLVVPALVLQPDRPWVYVGRFRVESLNRITFTLATEAERDAEWERLTNVKPPEPDKPVTEGLTDAVMGPGFERRKKEFENMTGGNAPPPVRIALLQKWLAESQTPRERAYVGSLLDRYTGGRRESPGPGPRPGLSSREQAIEEIRKRAQQQQNQPPPPPPPPPPAPKP
jgi:FtsZ-binding cell division protein ZapB